MRPAGVVAAAAVFLAASSARAEDAPEADPAAADEDARFEGRVRVGWRILEGEDEGRFLQDWGLQDGPRLFELEARGEDPARRSLFDEAELRAAGLGDRNSDATLTLRRRGVLDLTGGWRRDDASYRASGDPFPYDSVRDRGFLRGVWTPADGVALRLAWDRNQRRGHAFTRGYDGLSGESVGQRRRFEQETDRFTAGVDVKAGAFRFGLTESAALTDLADSRRFDDPDTPRSESIDRSVRGRSWTTAAKAGVTLLDGDLDSTLFFTRTRLPLDERTDAFVTDDSGERTETPGEGRLVRKISNWRWETSWRPARDWEVVAAAEREDIVDDQRGGSFFGPIQLADATARVTDRARRFSADVTWDVTEEVRLRLGEEFLRQEILAPTESHFGSPPGGAQEPSQVEGNSWRTVAGADWKPSKALSLSALARIATNDRPHTTVVGDQGDDWLVRARWKPLDELSLTSLARRKTISRRSTVPLYALGERPGAGDSRFHDLDSASRVMTLSQDAAWTSGPWSVTGGASLRRYDTNTDTGWGGAENGFVTFESVRFRGDDLTLTLDVRRDLTKSLRVFATASRTSARGDYDARWTDVSMGGSYDLDEKVTVGLTLSTWRFSERKLGADDYHVHGAELWVSVGF